jgi:hypothetical protein
MAEKLYFLPNGTTIDFYPQRVPNGTHWYQQSAYGFAPLGAYYG